MQDYETYTPKNKWEQDVLSYYEFQDDFGEPGDIRFKDRFVKARKKHFCTHCAKKEILPGETYRYAAYKFCGDLRTYRTCHSCCDAQAKSWKDNGKALDKIFA